MRSAMSRTFNKIAALGRTVVLTQALMVLVAVAVISASASAQPFVYVVSLGLNGPEFGTVDLANGRFRNIATPQVGGTPVSLGNLVWLDGSLLSLASSDPIAGYLVKINPETGDITPIGPTGLGYDAFSLAEAGGKLYLTDFNVGGGWQNLYSVDPQSGVATFIGHTGVPADVNAPFTTNADGTFNLCDETFYGVGGKLYVTFDANNFVPATLETNEYPGDATISPALYQIDPATGTTTIIGPTHVYLDASVEDKGTFYAFDGILTGFPGGSPAGVSELEKVDLTTGAATFLRVVEGSAGVIVGAAPWMPWSPEGASHPPEIGVRTQRQ
jgi:hypothetical protein